MCRTFWNPKDKVYQAKSPNSWNMWPSGLMLTDASDLLNALSWVVWCFSIFYSCIWPNVFIEVPAYAWFISWNSTLEISVTIVDYYKYICILYFYWFRACGTILSDVNSRTVLINILNAFPTRRQTLSMSSKYAERHSQWSWSRPQGLSDRSLTTLSNNIVGWSIVVIPVQWDT